MGCASILGIYSSDSAGLLVDSHLHLLFDPWPCVVSSSHRIEWSTRPDHTAGNEPPILLAVWRIHSAFGPASARQKSGLGGKSPPGSKPFPRPDSFRPLFFFPSLSSPGLFLQSFFFLRLLSSFLTPHLTMLGSAGLKGRGAMPAMARQRVAGYSRSVCPRRSLVAVKKRRPGLIGCDSVL